MKNLLHDISNLLTPTMPAGMCALDTIDTIMTYAKEHRWSTAYTVEVMKELSWLAARASLKLEQKAKK